MFLELLPVIITTMSPVAELRGGIPLGFLLGMPIHAVILTAFVVNCLIFFPIYFAVGVLYERVLIKIDWCKRLLDRIHRKGLPYIEKYGILGLAVYVGIPLPITGVWTGTILAWIFGLNWKKSFLSICIGVLIATTIISLISLGILTTAGIKPL